MITMKNLNLLCPVPQTQRPINEYKKIKKSVAFIWSTKSPPVYFQNILQVVFLNLLFCLFFVCTSSSSSNNLYNELLYSLIATSTLLIGICLRTYLGWVYVYDRLIQATVAYEESGWYDGQIWVKTPETLIQDKLAGGYTVLPLLNRLKNTIGIFLCILILSFLLLN
jgi:hypothetical protein